MMQQRTEDTARAAPSSFAHSSGSAYLVFTGSLPMRRPSSAPRTLLIIALPLLSRPLIAQSTFAVGSTTVQVTEMASHLDVPWDMVLGPDGWVWFTQINGVVSRMNPDDGTLENLYTVADVHETGLGGGLQSMAFHPDFANQPYVYLHYMNSSNTSVVKRFYYDAAQHTFTSASPSLLSLVLHGNASHNGSRIVVDDAGMFLMSIGDAMSGSAMVQDLSTSYGKILRFDPEGGIPADNPIPGSYVYNWGHRNPQGLVKASNGRIYNSAHGEGYDDEVNIVEPDRNYGWPTVLGYCNTPAEIAYCQANDVVEPIHEWSTVVVAPSGIDYYASDAIPEWQNSILVATLRGKAIHQLKLNTAGDTVLSDAAFLTDTLGRFRDVLALPDGRVFISTSNHDWAGSPAATDDRILRLEAYDPSSGMHAFDAAPLRLWPNPASGTLHISGALRSDARISIEDPQGRMIMPARSLRDGQLDVSQLSSGAYLLRVVQQDRPMIARFVVR